MTQLTIVRGLPGAGKSTYAKTVKAMHFESDMFFEDHLGKYEYNRNLIGAAHDWCYGHVVKCLMYGFDVVVSNTFCAEWEMEKYLNLPNLMPEVELHVVELHTQYGSIHGVPDEAVERMKARWFNLPDHYCVKVIK